MEAALREERNKQASNEYQLELSKNKIRKLELEVRQYRNKENEYDSLKKTFVEQEEKYRELETEKSNLIVDFELRLKLNEDKTILREEKMKRKEVEDVKKNYELEIMSYKSEIETIKKEISYYTKKIDELEKENSYLKINSKNNIEINSIIKELQQDNFILHEKNNELKDKLERITSELDKTEKRLISQKMENTTFNNVNFQESKLDNLKGLDSIKFSNDKLIFGNNTNAKNIDSNNNNIFEQLYIERVLIYLSLGTERSRNNLEIIY